MRWKLLIVLVIVAGLGLSSGCSSYTGYSNYQNMRRLAIAGEELKIMGQDFDRLIDLEEYPTFGRWQH